jgi:predicted nucleic acid-binding protein
VSGIILDSGALIGLERGDRTLYALLRRAMDRDDEVIVPSGVLAQVWRGGPRQARLASMLRKHNVRIAELDATTARLVGRLLGHNGTADVVDTSVVIAARMAAAGAVKLPIVTSDPDDITRLDPTIPLIVV